MREHLTHALNQWRSFWKGREWRLLLMIPETCEINEFVDKLLWQSDFRAKQTRWWTFSWLCQLSSGGELMSPSAGGAGELQGRHAV